MSELTHVVVGGGLAAAKAVESLREYGDQGRVVLVGDEREYPYERPPLSKDYLAGATAVEKLRVREPDWYSGHQVELRLGTRVMSIDRFGSRIELADGTRIPYDRLLLATGSAPRKLSMPGSELTGIHYLRRIRNADLIRATIGHGGPLVVIGAGWIGLEVAAVARQAGIPVVLLEAAPAPLAGVLGEEVGQRFAELHRAHGVDVRTGVSIRRFVGETAVEGVVLGNGAVIPAAGVVVGVGIRPMTELAEAAGLPVDDGIVVDSTLRTEDPKIWAAGDVASAHNEWLGRRLRVEHFDNADKQGAFAGRSMAGAQERWSAPPFFWSDQYDVGLEYRGWADPRSDLLVLRGRPEDGAWYAFWLDDSHAVRAGMHVNGWDGADQVKALVADRVVVDPRALADPGTGWEAVRQR